MKISINPSLESERGATPAMKTRKVGRPRKLFRSMLLVFSLCLVFVVGVMAYYSRPALSQYNQLTHLIDRLLENRYHELVTPSFRIHTGMDLDSAKLINRLTELGYQRNRNKTCPAGSFFVDGGELFLTLKGQQAEKNTRKLPMRKFLIHLDGNVVKKITNVDTGKEVAGISLEPLVLTSFIDRIWEIRIPKTYNHIPKDLINAVLATEDQKFFHHPGVDALGIIRAAWINYRAGAIRQGGSTITQQVVKILLQRRERSMEKKYTEALLALALERRYSKQELLTIYLNNVYLGQAAPFEIRGMGAAANYLLGKDLEELDLKECALLAGLIRSPNSASPIRNPKKAATRTKTVLHQLHQLGDPLAGEISIGKKLRRIRRQGLLHQQSWFFDELEKELKKMRILPARFADGQLVIHITLDPWLQTIACRNLRKTIPRLEKKKKMAPGSLQGATVILDPETGGVLSLVGGTSYLRAPFNRAVAAQRQIGSLIKPFVYLAALGGPNVAGRITQATIIKDTPLALNLGGSTWKPHNYDRKYKGAITVRRALVESRNIPAIKVGRMVGLEAITTLIRELGINDNPPRVPALLLGAIESTPLRMAGAYSVLANGGSRVYPHLVAAVERDGRIVYRGPQPQPMLAPGPCFVVTDILREVMVSGTARASRRLGFHQLAAGKTGTTNRLRDAWFAGYTPSLVTVCWVGRDNNKPSRLTGGSGALPLWVAVMKDILGQGKSQKFRKPPSVFFADIDTRNGLLATSGVKSSAKMAFVRGTEPNRYSTATVAATRQSKPKLRPVARKQQQTTEARQSRRHIPARRQDRPWLFKQFKKTADWFKNARR